MCTERDTHLNWPSAFLRETSINLLSLAPDLRIVLSEYVCVICCFHLSATRTRLHRTIYLGWSLCHCSNLCVGIARRKMVAWIFLLLGLLGYGIVNYCMFSLLKKFICPSLWRNRLEADCGSEGMGFDPHSGQSKVRLVSLSILTDKIVLVAQSCRVPYSSINWFAGVSIKWPAAPNMLRCLWA
jgi:hypothetical protein